MQSGANGVRYFLVSGVPSISGRWPDDAPYFSRTACEGHSALCSPSHEETVRDPRPFSGYRFTFTLQFSWEDLTSHGSSWSISGTTFRALFATGDVPRGEYERSRDTAVRLPRFRRAAEVSGARLRTLMAQTHLGERHLRHDLRRVCRAGRSHGLRWLEPCDAGGDGLRLLHACGARHRHQAAVCDGKPCREPRF